ncbi:MAG: hypothetical protein D6759_17860, partial [Chloroflexi bacterium]
GHRVPAMAYWPGQIEPGSVCRKTAMGMDLFPTFVALAGGDLPTDRPIDGVDLSPLLFGTGSLTARPLFWRSGGRKAVRYGEWKLVIGERDQPGPALYNLDADPQERQDLAKDAPGRVQELLGLLEHWEGCSCLCEVP